MKQTEHNGMRVVCHNGDLSPRYDLGQWEELDGWDLDKMPDGTDALHYWYQIGSYEGTGEALFRCDGQWFRWDMGHCSCFGPLEKVDKSMPWNLQGEDMTDELRNEIAPLDEAARSTT